ncbi:probable E3 ubiquitin-protein ligase RHG1A isoform X1 [Cryptomeria japonica]|uniref:probable E3 ubiquitin-protein ligase RHG1A isoform X1 n=1 Tax=Cryptomeria japonica TaxID=3369 RepID=UPI0025AD31E4|nr:probable E3 ubiquitin-protein ligase RHG1A isoform X1 [Cryptomeria japonica]
MSRLATEIRETQQSDDTNDQSHVNATNRNSRPDRSNKGRRRRAAAEQRRIDQQRWGQYLTDEEEEQVPIAPRSNTRRRARKNKRNNSIRFLDEEEYYEDELSFHATGARDEFCEDFDLEMALSLSLSLGDSAPNSGNHDHSNRTVVNMSYESLVQLEDVKCVAPENVVNSLLNTMFDGNKSDHELTEEEEKCAICQCEYECGDRIMTLPCAHALHHACGSQWLLNYSKLCPICKLDVTDKKVVDM